MLNGLIGRVSAFLVAVVVITVAFSPLRPLSAVQPQVGLLTAPAPTAVSLPWPAYGQSAIGAEEFGLLESHGSLKPAPIASLAKIITAMSVLKQKPLAANQQGPTLTLGAADVNDYNNYVSQDGSVVPVQVGEQLSERQALEAMLLPSANNMAYSLAAWAFGSLDNYTVFANQYVKTLGMDHTSVADASGFSPSTTSTAEDLVRLGLAAMNNPVLAQIAAEETATIPVAGSIHNLNWLLGTNGIVGIKTGNTDQAGGCYLFAARHDVRGQSIILVGAIMGAPNLYISLADGHALVNAFDSGFELVTPAKAGQVIGHYASSWGAKTNAISQTSLSILRWRSQSIKISAHLLPLKPGAKAHTAAGELTASVGNRKVSVPLVSSSSLDSPSWFWRWRHL